MAFCCRRRARARESRGAGASPREALATCAVAGRTRRPGAPTSAPGFPPPPPADIIVRPPRRKQPLCQICTCDKKVAEFASPLFGVVLYENVVVSTLTSYFQPSAQGNTTYGSISKELRVEAPSKPSQMFHADWRGVKAFQSSAVTGASCQLLALSISACA